MAHASLLCLFLLPVALGNLEGTFRQCCKLGTAIAAQNLMCNEAMSEQPVQGVPAEQLSVCLPTMQLCCVRTLREIHCMEGKVAATKGVSCHTAKHEETKYCCEACKLGIISASMTTDCQANELPIGYMFVESYKSCCTSIAHSRTTPARPALPPPPTTETSIEKNNLNVNICDLLRGEVCAHRCVPTGSNSYRCSCEPGFTLMADGKSCQQDRLRHQRVDRCEISNPCQQLCTDTGDIVKCSCQPGFQLHSDGKSCHDIDECKLNEFPCDSNQMCENNIGSYVCHCKTGFESDSITNACIDVNECQAELHNCSPSQRCDNTIGSFQCVRYINCGTGYTLNAQTSLCEDNDECASHMCDHLGPDYKCRNILGSFRCDKILVGSSTMKPWSSETNVSTTIVKCPAGYYVGPGKLCLDVNECDRGGLCRPDQTCMNIPGGYICSNKRICDNGLRHNEATNQCVDINECNEQPGICAHNCYNTWGSFLCSCLPGYNLFQDNRTCIDVNECDVYKSHRLCAGDCINQPGSYTCRCPPGYRLGFDGASCQDIDECSNMSLCTNKDEMCLNMRGSYKCVNTTCTQDYIKDVQHKNRCKRKSMSCQQGDMECENKPLTYSFHFITLVSNLTTPVDLFMMRGPIWSSTNVEFKLHLEKVHTPHTAAATLNDFHLQHTDHNVVNIRLVRPIIGPMDIYLELMMKFYYNGIYGGTSISKISIFVSQYEF